VGEQLREAQNINRSLSQLEMVRVRVGVRVGVRVWG